MIRLLLWLASILIVLPPPPATLAQAPRQRHIATQFIAETDEPAAGSIVSFAIRMTPQPGWHGYLKNPDDSGIEPSIRWTLPPGAAAGPLLGLAWILGRQSGVDGMAIVPRRFAHSTGELG